ncbi:MAG: hypothetical protein Q9212_003107 [Teloschistes hypoglaucus]
MSMALKWSSAQTTNSTDLQVCSLFYEGVASRLHFPGVDPENDQGTCSDALTAACVEDLRKQSQDELIKIARDQESSGDSSPNRTSCERLADTLRDHAPASCAIATNGNWGTVQARTVPNLTAAIPVPRGGCHPTTGADYRLFPIEANRFNVSAQSPKELQTLLFSVTPILTVVYGSNATDIEVDLSCLKTIGSKAGMVTDKTSAAPATRLDRALTLSPVIIASFVLLF